MDEETKAIMNTVRAAFAILYGDDQTPFALMWTRPDRKARLASNMKPQRTARLMEEGAQRMREIIAKEREGKDTVQ